MARTKSKARKGSGRKAKGGRAKAAKSKRAGARRGGSVKARKSKAKRGGRATAAKRGSAARKGRAAGRKSASRAGVRRKGGRATAGKGARKAHRPGPATENVFGEGNYAASREFRQEETNFVRRNRGKIARMGKDAEAAMDGPEGKELQAAEDEAKSHAAGAGEE